MNDPQLLLNLAKREQSGALQKTLIRASRVYHTFVRANLCYVQTQCFEQWRSKIKTDEYEATYTTFGRFHWGKPVKRSHSFNDEPAIRWLDGRKLSWFWHGAVHRGNDLPAVVMKSGARAWFWHGKRHRFGNLPAVYGVHSGDLITQRTINIEYWKHGVLHRSYDEPARIVFKDDEIVEQEWIVNGARHREGRKPARIAYGAEEIWHHNKRIEHPKTSICRPEYLFISAP